jgi:hypothetical protein
MRDITKFLAKSRPARAAVRLSARVVCNLNLKVSRLFQSVAYAPARARARKRNTLFQIVSHSSFNPLLAPDQQLFDCSGSFVPSRLLCAITPMR